MLAQFRLSFSGHDRGLAGIVEFLAGRLGQSAHELADLAAQQGTVQLGGLAGERLHRFSREKHLGLCYFSATVFGPAGTVFDATSRAPSASVSETMFLPSR